VPRHFGYDPRPHHGDCFPHRPGFLARESHTHFEPKHLDGPCFLRCVSHPTWSSDVVQKIVKTSPDRMVKCGIPKIYLNNLNIEPSTSSYSM
jgi:hypothetical protein